MDGVATGRTGSFSTGVTETKNPSLRPVQFQNFQSNSVFDQSQVRGSSNGLSTQDYDRRRVGGGMAPSPNGASSTTYDQRQWIDKNPYRTIGD